MNIESQELLNALIQLKEKEYLSLDRAKHNKIKSIIEARIDVLETILMWINQTKKDGIVNMETLKLGEVVKWQPKRRTRGIDELIINDVQSLQKNFDAIKIKSETVNWTSLLNRTYALRNAGQISDHIVPRRDKDGTKYLVYLDNPPPKRSKK